jgi:HPt (histidine-containing phosphotransfer) domain-containing protein
MFEVKKDIPDPQFSDVIDWKRLCLVTMEDPEYQIKLLKTFAETAQTYLEEIDGAVTDKDYEEVVNGSHKLKGISAHLGLRRMSELADQLENRGSENRLEDAELLLAQLRVMLRRVRELIAALRSRL